jgi:hypothetical protein
VKSRSSPAANALAYMGISPVCPAANALAYHMYSHWCNFKFGVISDFFRSRVPETLQVRF